MRNVLRWFRQLELLVRAQAPAILELKFCARKDDCYEKETIKNLIDPALEKIKQLSEILISHKIEIAILIKLTIAINRTGTT